MSLKMWQCEIDIVIAESAEEAIILSASLHGKANNLEEALDTIENDYGIAKEDYMIEKWTEFSPDTKVTINYIDEGIVIEKTVQEWIDEQGECYFACTEY